MDSKWACINKPTQCARAALPPREPTGRGDRRGAAQGQGDRGPRRLRWGAHGGAKTVRLPPSADISAGISEAQGVILCPPPPPLPYWRAPINHSHCPGTYTPHCAWELTFCLCVRSPLHLSRTSHTPSPRPTAPLFLINVRYASELQEQMPVCWAYWLPLQALTFSVVSVTVRRHGPAQKSLGRPFAFLACVPKRALVLWSQGEAFF